MDTLTFDLRTFRLERIGGVSELGTFLSSRLGEQLQLLGFEMSPLDCDERTLPLTTFGMGRCFNFSAWLADPTRQASLILAGFVTLENTGFLRSIRVRVLRDWDGYGTDGYGTDNCLLTGELNVAPSALRSAESREVSAMYGPNIEKLQACPGVADFSQFASQLAQMLSAVVAA